MARINRRASSRRTREIERGTWGTHVPRRPPSSRSSRSGRRNSINFQNRSSARTGEISQVMPETRTRESHAAYTQRRNQRGLVWHDRTRSRVRSIITVVLIALVLLTVALGVAWFVFKLQIDSKMNLHDPAVAEVLSAPEDENDPYYILLAGTFDDPMREHDGPHMLTLVRVDKENRTFALVNLPYNIEMTMSDDEYHILSYAQILGGDAELVTQVENLCGVELSHLIEVDDKSFVNIVDALGGIDIDLAHEMDDPDTGSIYIPAGQQHLNGEETLALVRCDNYTTPLETRSRVQAQVMEALMQKLLSKTRVGELAALDKLAGSIDTTMSFDDVWSIVRALGNGNDVTVYSSIVPGVISVDPDGTFFSVQRASFDSMMEAVRDGRNPDEAATISGLTPDLVRINVKNGAGITGGAAQVAEKLDSYGYKVPEKGNADNYVYDETLVVYKSNLYKPTAEEVLSILGNGRTIEAGLFYEFDEDILVIIGKDWIPTS